MSANANLANSDGRSLKNPPMYFDAARRSAVEATIKEVCSFREIGLPAIHVRTNHAHVVILTTHRPEPIMNAFKSYATRRLRENGLIGSKDRVWSRHGSTRYLWTAEHVSSAVEYVVNGQGDELPKFD